MAKVLFKKGPSQSFDTDKDLNSIIFKKSTNPQAPGFSEIYLGDNRCGVGHNFSIGSDGLVPAPTMADIGKVLTPNGWIDVSKISGSDNVKQVGIESSTTLYPILLKGTTGVSDYTGQVNFTSGVNQNTPLLSASPDGHLNCKSLGVMEGDISCLLGDINLMDIPVMSGGHSLNLVSSVNGSTESSPSILLARSESLGTTTDRYTNWRIQNAANGVLTFTPEKTGGSETPFVSVLSNVTAISFTVSGVSSSDTYIKADGSGYGGVFTGAGQAAGTAGLVPAPAIGDAGKYLKGDGTWGEIQSGSDLATPVTYSELVTLKTGGNLVPGTQYRITDYTCTTTQANTQSASHVFDIIVTADSETELNENARAAHHTGDTYFTNCNLDAWELKYCLENDTNRFVWADTTNGKGVIYYMKDEWNNIAPFDFKNMMFTRDRDWFVDHDTWAEDVLGEVPLTSMNFYFLSWVTQNNEVQDLSIVGQTLTNNGGKYVGVFNNEIKGTSAYDMSITENATTTAFALPCTIIVNNYSYGSGNFYGCYGNSFGNSCYNNSFGNKCYCVTFGNKCYGNTFGNDCYGNSLDHSCYNNSFGNTCSNNTFRNNCFNNSFGGGCFQNSFGVGCYGNTFGENFQLNSFGDYCYENTFGSNIQSLTAFEHVHWCNVTGGTNTPIKNTQILNGTHGTSGSSKLTITFTANKVYTQVAGQLQGNALRIWIAEDTVTGPSSAVSNRIAVFNGTTGKIIKDSGVRVSDLLTDIVTYVTYSDLVDLKTEESLFPGMQYRITDYTCTTTQADTQSAGHVFDIIVTADSVSELNENARAAHHEDDTYFENCDLDSWEIKYCLENDTNRFAWADTTNGKGVIYYMKDEWNNECPYDFKNMMFLRGQLWRQEHQELEREIFGDCEEEYFYTFSCYDTENLQLGDASLKNCDGIIHDTEECSCFCNTIKIRKGQSGAYEDSGNLPAYLNNIVFFNTYETDSYFSCFFNVFENDCFDNIFGNNCHVNSFLTGCQNNSFGDGCHQNSFGNNCRDNTLWSSCSRNTFGDGCSQNTFGNGCQSNSFGDGCSQNTFGNGCQSNSFGNSCSQNTFGDGCQNNSFGNYCSTNSFGNYCQYITIFDGVQYCNITGGTSSAPVKNAQILNGTKGVNASNTLTITFTANQNYTQVAGLVNGTNLRIWTAENTVTGPSYAENNRIAVFDGFTGKTIKDGGVRVSDILTLDDLTTPVTYDELVNLITGEMLVPGMQYRITDYDCTTTQENTSSAGYVFDIIVTADSETELNENARAAHHDGDDHFTNCDLGAWELKYSIYNDKNKFSWADCNYVAVSEIQTIKPEADELFALPEAANILQNYWQETISSYISGAQVAFFASDSGPSETIFRFSNDGGSSLSNDLFITIPTNSLVYSNSLLTIKCGNSEYKIHLGEIDGETVSETTDGKGVIYYMKDELGNECPYDFKNIMFKRWAVTEVTNSVLDQGTVDQLNDIFVFDGDNTKFQTRFSYQGSNCNHGSTTYVVNPNDYGWYYTFSIIMNDVDSGEFAIDNIEDGSIKGNNYYNDASAGGFYGNIIMPRYDSMASDDDGIDGAQVLNNIVLNGSYQYFQNETGEKPYISGCCNNSFGYNCYKNTFGNGCDFNSFDENCSSIIFGNGCIHNSFDYNCSNNTLGNNCSTNSFGNGCGSNTFGKNAFSNSFGNNCSINSFGNIFRYNSFGTNCNQNSFGNNCSTNSFGTNCYQNTFGKYCQHITVFNNVQNCNITGGTSTAPVKNAQILNGTKGTSSSNTLTIPFATNKDYTQVAGLVNGTTLRIWIAEDTVTGPSSAISGRIAVFNGGTGKIIKDSGVTVADLQVDVPEYTIEKLNQAETGYASSYVLKKDDVQVGATINIPKDMVVSSGEVKTVTTANVPYQGAQVGDKYIDLTIANSSSQHIYIPVKDLVDVYQAGNGISIDASNYISVKIDSANANGLDTTTAGLKLDTVTTTTNGAMLATDKVKLDSINGNYWGSQTLSAAASYITTPEFQQVTINGDPTATQASTDHCVMVYDTTNKCLKFTF